MARVWRQQALIHWQFGLRYGLKMYSVLNVLGSSDSQHLRAGRTSEQLPCATLAVNLVLSPNVGRAWM
jgi:hypothetical protein